MTALVLAGLVAGVLCPPVVSFLKRDHFPSIVNQLIAILVALAAAAVATAVTGGLWTVPAFLAHAGIIIGVQQTIYGLYFKGSPLEELLTALGIALTSSKKVAG